jgi:hypothetical protein
MARNRVIYQSEALFVSPNATGAHFSLKDIVMATGGKASAGDNMAPSGLYKFPLNIGLDQDPATTAGLSKAAQQAAVPAFAPNYIDYVSGQIEAAYAAGSVSNVITDGLPTSATEWPAISNSPFLTGYNQPHPGQTQGTNRLNDAGAVEGAVMFDNLEDWEDFRGEGGSVQQGATGFLLLPESGTNYNQVQQLHRVQSANYSFTINRTDVNTFGQLARIDSVVLEPPTVNLDFSYYPTDGFNERNLGFYLQGVHPNPTSQGTNKGLRGNEVGYGMGLSQLNAVSGHLQDDAAGRNFFILTTPEGTDAFHTTRADSERSVIGLGNGFLSDWSLDAAVGGIPSANATVELFNAKTDVGVIGKTLPSVNLVDGSPITTSDFSLYSPSTGDVTATALRPGDVTMEIPQGLSIFADVSGDGACHIQNMSLSVPLSRSPIDRLGTRFAFSRVVDFPVVSTLTVSALVSDLNTANLANLIDSCDEHDVKITMKANSSCGVGDNMDSLIIDFKGARVDSESMSSDIGSNKSVDLSFTTQIGGPEDTEHGVLISGANRTFIPRWLATPGR